MDITKIEALPLPPILTDEKMKGLKDLRAQLRVSWFDLEGGAFFGKTWVCPGEVSLLGGEAVETPNERRNDRSSTVQSKASKVSVNPAARKKPVKKPKVMKKPKTKKKKKTSILSDSLDSSADTTSDEYSDSSSEDSESESEDESEYSEKEPAPPRSASPTRSVAASPAVTGKSVMTKHIVGHSLSIKLKEQQVYRPSLIVSVR